MVDAVITVEDDEHGSACNAISACLEIAETVVFATAEIVDQTIHQRQISLVMIPEELEFGVGGTDKKNSSSWLLHNYFERQRKIVGI